jgi:DNA (cytosine-5)-methyltransferase 1
MSRPKMLELFCCAGGMAMGYHRAGFDVYGVDIDPQPNYPFPFRHADAANTMVDLLDGKRLEFIAPTGASLLMGMEDFDAAHASPPCQSFLSLGAVNKALGRTYDYPNLIGPIRDLLIESGLPYVIENVENARKELHDPVRICGTALGLPLRRHRLFESSAPITGIDCEHHRFTEKKYWTSFRPNGERRLSSVVQVYGNGGHQHEWPAAMGIDWMTPHEMAEAIPPAYAEHVGVQLMRHLEAAA